MRYLQIILFLCAALSFLSSLFFVGSVTGDVLWRAGIAILLLDMVCILLRPDKGKA